MKKQLLFALIVTLISSIVYSQIPEEGLIGYYKLDDESYIDHSPSGYDLEVVDIGGFLLANPNRFGEADKATKYINQYMNMDSNPNVFDFDTDGMFTLCTWIKIDETVIDWTGLLNNWAGFGVGGYWLGITPSQQIRWNINADPPIDSTPVATGEWIHLAASYDGVTAKLYINGLMVASETYGVGILSSPFSFTVASQADVPTNQLPGVLDDILVYNRTLSDSEIEDIFNVLSIEDINEFSENIQVFPNPVNYTFTFTYNQSLGTLVSYSISDMGGSIIRQSDIDDLNQNVDVSNLSNGVYLITFRSVDGIPITKRIIKK